MTVPLNLETKTGAGELAVGLPQGRLQALGRDARHSDRASLHDSGISPLDEVRYEHWKSVINNPDGSVVFKMDDAEIPAGWSQLATDIVVSKYFRKAGFHSHGWPWRDLREAGRPPHRARTSAQAGEHFGGYFATRRTRRAFEDELSSLLVHQYGAFNSPVWFNCGL